MTVIAMAVRGVVMRGVTMACVTVWLALRMTAAGIGAAFGIERRFDLDDARAQPFHHRLDDVVAPDPQAFAHDLGRQMAVAEMPGDPDQMLRIAPAYFEQRFRRCDDFDQPAVVEHQRVAAAQRDRGFQIEQEFKPARACHRHPAPVTIVEIEHDGIGRRLRPAVSCPDLRRADHAKAFF
jgi:hypothetical protein